MNGVTHAIIYKLYESRYFLCRCTFKEGKLHGKHLVFAKTDADSYSFNEFYFKNGKMGKCLFASRYSRENDNLILECRPNPNYKSKLNYSMFSKSSD